MQSNTYERSDLDVRRLGLVAGENWHNGDQSKTFGASRLAGLFIVAVRTLANRSNNSSLRINGVSSLAISYSCHYGGDCVKVLRLHKFELGQLRI